MRVFTLLLCVWVISVSDAALHLPLEMTHSEYAAFYAELKQTKSINVKDPFVQEAIDGGEKMSAWVKLINEHRDPKNAIRLTSKSTLRGIPIDTPSEYGPSTIKAKILQLKSDLPKELAEVFYGKVNISKTPILADDIFIKWARKVSKQYQSAVRWTGMQRWLPHYASRKAKDVRGYYYLKNLANLDKTLDEYSELSQEEVQKINEALIGICINGKGSKKTCERRLLKAIRGNDLKSYKNKYWAGATKNWNSFFEISNPRTDVIWKKKAPGVMEVVFKDPKNEEIASWLKENVEDEFRLESENWAMEMRYIPGRFGTAHLEFKKNVTPHVSGGNKIVMDANTALEEYGVKWTIRHEFGHILRIPDCYHEFYDKERNLMINYQLDVTDLMCSRAGSMNKRIFKELKKNYLK